MAEHDLVVVGAGPAGRALAHRAARAGLDVALVDRAPHRPWRSTFAAWTHELPDWLPARAIGHQVPSVAAYTPRRHHLERGYTVLSDHLQDALALDRVTTVSATAEHVGTRHVDLAGGDRVTGRTVVDARGGGSTRGPAQTAYGVFVPAGVAAPLLAGDPAVLMDWRTDSAQPDAAASFLYVVPVSADRVLIEETCLAGDPALGLGELRERLHTRTSSAEVDLTGYETEGDIERVHFALTVGGGRPWTHRPIRFGAAGGLMHPATGYSVATSLRSADVVVDAIVSGDDIARHLWRNGARTIHTLRRRGLNALLRLDASTTVAFFDAFFAMPESRQRAYLSERAAAPAVMGSMLTLMRYADPGIGLTVARGAAVPTRW